jgi:DNA uptake protein ComE-like DNA-binding protein
MRGRSEKGVALICVLWTLVLLSIVAAVLSLETRASARIARNMADDAAARAAADAGIQRAMRDLATAPGADNKALRAVYDWRFANSPVHISVQDESSKIDLNQGPVVVLTALFETVGIESAQAQSLSDAIADFRDADNLPRLPGAEEANYRSAGLAWAPKNAPFQGIEELQQVLGITAEIYRRVAPELTIYSILDYSATARSSPATDDRLKGILRRAGLDSSLTNSPGLALSIRAEAKSSNGAVFIREAVVQPASRKTRQRVLSWREGRSPSEINLQSVGVSKFEK